MNLSTYKKQLPISGKNAVIFGCNKVTFIQNFALILRVEFIKKLFGLINAFENSATSCRTLSLLNKSGMLDCLSNFSYCHLDNLSDNALNCV